MKASPNAGDEALRQMSQAVQLFDKSEGIKVLLLGRWIGEMVPVPGTPAISVMLCRHKLLLEVPDR